jgi:glycosyltransferase involved in cell wall biosynthesis
MLLSDDLRMHSGVATMSRELVLGTCHKYHWIQVAGAIKNPDAGKILDLSQATKQMIKEGKVKSDDDVYIKLFPIDGYGNEDILYSIINMERPDAILHFTDPRFWGWLYQLENTIRKKIPLTYLNIWDDIPYPMYNRPFYESCDALLSISKQTENINKWVLDPKNCCTVTEPMNGKTLLHYVPHGINEAVFQRKDPTTQDYKDRYKAIFRGKKYDFVIFYNSRNVQRKRTSNIMLAYRAFCDQLPKEQAEKCCLLLHTEIMHEAGTNLIALKEALCPDYDVIFSPAKIPPEEMPYLYTMADVTINASSSEGFGLSIAESLMCETPIIATVTGGLQDQIGQTDDNGKPVEFTQEFSSNNCGKYKNHGVWAYPLWPATRLIQGSIPTPYIFDDLVKWEDITDAFAYWYKMPEEQRRKCGKEGRRWVCNEGGLNATNMCSQFVTAMDYVFQNWKPSKNFGIYSVKDHVGNFMLDKKMGFEIPLINEDAVSAKLKETETKLATLV